MMIVNVGCLLNIHLFHFPYKKKGGGERRGKGRKRRGKKKRVRREKKREERRKEGKN